MIQSDRRDVRVAGRLRPRHEADVTADVPGRVEEILADVGAPVSKGQALARLDDGDLVLQVARARAADAVLRAPFSGVVVRRATDIGNQLAPGMPAFGIADVSQLELGLDDRFTSRGRAARRAEAPAPAMAG